MSEPIAIVGMACIYPDARSPLELWETVLARRRAFRRIPPERLRLEDYLAENTGSPDSTYVRWAALLADYEFDRVAYRVGEETYRSADLTHWLALDVASRALQDAGFPGANGLPCESTGAIVGNSLTGEFSRAAAMRLRFPYVRRILDAEFRDAQLPDELSRALLARIEARYKAPFAKPNEDTLAGGLSNTIAGRICNYYNLRGGGYVVDGACASSLLAITTACNALSSGDLDVALAGGVDISLDPFELVGFARAGALAADEMRVFDERSAGFWPGEGAGFLVLMRYTDALALSRRVYALVRGWGVSSDGSGGLIRPDVDGQRLAFRRAYARAGFGMDTVAYFEGHGTGTATGDSTEIIALSRSIRAARQLARPAGLGSIKANIGHTKAAAGVAGVIKATIALQAQLLPPTSGCETPHPELRGPEAALRVVSEPEPWPSDQPLRAAVSAMGFGGINTHIVLEAATSERRGRITIRECQLSSSQDEEVLLFSAPTLDALAESVRRVAELVPKLSLAELSDLSAVLCRDIDAHSLRAAVVGPNSEAIGRALGALSSWLALGRSAGIDKAAGAFLGSGSTMPRIALLFPGQAAPIYRDGGALSRRFEFVRRSYGTNPLPGGTDTDAELAQSAIVLSAVAGLDALEHVGLRGNIALGHSLGELVAFHWAGVFDRAALLRIVAARSRAFAAHARHGGAMAAIMAGPAQVEALTRQHTSGQTCVACLNGPRQTIVSGLRHEVAAVIEAAQALGIRTAELRVSHAFHSPAMLDAAQVFARSVAKERLGPAGATIVSSVTGDLLEANAASLELLSRQIAAPVRFSEALEVMLKHADLVLEVGPGSALSALVSDVSDVPVVSLDAGSRSIRGFLAAVATAFVMGAPIDSRRLQEGRFTRKLDLHRPPRLLSNPCESAPAIPADNVEAPRGPVVEATRVPAVRNSDSPLEMLIDLVERRTQLPRTSIEPSSRFMSDLHLSSIAVTQIIGEATSLLGRPAARALSTFADATLQELARALMGATQENTTPEDGAPRGVDTWVRPFRVTYEPRGLAAPLHSNLPGLSVLAPEDHPLTEPLRRRFCSSSSTEGVLVCVPPVIDRQAIELMLNAARRIVAERGPRRFVLVHRGIGPAFARTLHLEMPDVVTIVVEVPIEHPSAVDWIAAEVMCAQEFVDVRYDDAGQRWCPILELDHGERRSVGALLERDDTLLITGGAKGITLECALALASATRARVVLLGRARPEADEVLRTNLGRIRDTGLDIQYLSADITDEAQVSHAIASLRERLPITALLHGAGLNVPTPLGSLSEDAFERTVAVKVNGLRNILRAIDPAQLRMLVGLGSIIARVGMPGEADYAVANEALRLHVDDFARTHTSCRCLCVEYSVWAGIGMGERLGSLDELARQGISPIPKELGVAALLDQMRRSGASTSVVLMSRTRATSTLPMRSSNLPLLRFLEHPMIDIPGVELISDADLSIEGDPYLADHVIGGDPVLPGVIGLEAMAQVASTLVGSADPPVFENIAFLQPIVVGPGRTVRIRIAALVREPGVVDVVVRSAATAMTEEHFRARCRFGSTTGDAHLPLKSVAEDPVDVDPYTDLYGKVFFHEGRFRRIAAYQSLSSRRCVAEISPDSRQPWFGRFLPARLVLGDPAARDAAVHAIQACIPHVTVIPVSVDRLWMDTRVRHGPTFVHAEEREDGNGRFVYDVVVTNNQGAALERWEGLHLHVVKGASLHGHLPTALIGPRLERLVRRYAPRYASVSVAMIHEPDRTKEARSERALSRAMSAYLVMSRDGDVSPQPSPRASVKVSEAHAEGLTMAVVAPTLVTCAMNLVSNEENVTLELTDLTRSIIRANGEALLAGAARVRGARECMQSMGVAPELPLGLADSDHDGGVLLRAGRLSIVSLIVKIDEVAQDLAISILLPE